MQVRCVRTFEEWRTAARPLLSAAVQADEIEWQDFRSAERPHDSTSVSQALASTGSLRISRAVLRLVQCISHYRHAGRWELMYRLTWRALYENARLLEDQADPDVRNASLMERAVNRECHKMRAFVRFREIDAPVAGKAYFAWFEPEHEILRRAVPFFGKRFPNMNWTIATPDGAAVWENRHLRFIDLPERTSLPKADEHEVLWRTYYRSICNVSRINPSVMQREMPQRYWKHLPEAAEIAPLIRDGRAAFVQGQHEKDDVGLKMSRAVQQALAKLPPLAEGPSACRRCDLWRHATQAVDGEGPDGSAIMLVGEQPGDEEDLRGRAFVGPAGQVLNAALGAAGIHRDNLYITNAVKHFKWEPRGKRRMHKRPEAGEISACNVWLRREISRVGPRVIVALGATAMRAILGSVESIESARNSEHRHESGALVICTYHPSAILRADAGRAAVLRQALEEDLKHALSCSPSKPD